MEWNDGEVERTVFLRRLLSYSKKCKSTHKALISQLPNKRVKYFCSIYNINKIMITFIRGKH